MENQVFVMDHPLIQHKLTFLRSKDTGSKEFRELVSEIGMLMCYEATRDLPLQEVEIKTPITTAKFKTIAGKKLAIVPILRAGLGMVDGIMSLVPAAKVGHIGLYRDESNGSTTHEYYCKLPFDIANREVIILDPMLATGGSAVKAINIVKKAGAKQIKFMCIVTCPQGLKAVQDAHPDVDIITGAIDEGLNENLYIVPGIGDCGDRLFGTK